MNRFAVIGTYAILVDLTVMADPAKKDTTFFMQKTGSHSPSG